MACKTSSRLTAVISQYQYQFEFFSYTILLIEKKQTAYMYNTNRILGIIILFADSILTKKLLHFSAPVVDPAVLKK